MSHTKLESIITGRESSLFEGELEAHHKLISERLSGSSVLVIGAAGSIGRFFTKLLIRYPLKSVTLVDPNENTLVELIRDIRSSDTRHIPDIQTYSIAIGSIEFERFISGNPNFTYVANFAALKHVRSERDPFSLMNMISTNVLSLEQILFSTNLKTEHFFSVSSDKAAYPANILGATKLLMERYMNTSSLSWSSARFANVAFSDGSLLQNFENRFKSFHPLAAPSDVKRYFISLVEAGELCLLAMFLSNSREIFFPKLEKNLALKSFSELATTFLDLKGYTPFIAGSEIEAKSIPKEEILRSKQWPCYFHVSDTSGEKEEEEFVMRGEKIDLGRYATIGVITDPQSLPEELEESLRKLRSIREGAIWKKPDIIDAIKIAVPEMTHVEREKNLDQKM
jgi:FlaA1/EpsC-like NDP-sugar epimerase